MNSVAFDFQFTKDEYQRAVRRILLGRIVVPPLLFILAGILFNAIVYFCVLALIMAALPLFMVPRKLWVATPGIQERRTYVVSDEGISMHSAPFDIRCSWVTRMKSREFAGYYSIRGISGGLLTIVPKRAFKSPDDEATFRSLLRRYTRAQLRSSENTVST